MKKYPPSYFDKYYVEKSRSNLETEAIQTYLKTNKVEHIPVDIDDLPDEEFFKNYRKAIEQIERLTDVNGFNYRNAVDTNKRFAALHGFPYLNSDNAIAYNNEIRDVVKKALEAINDDKIFQACNLWDKLTDRRENEMLQNIYSYSKKHPYDRAVFLLGAAHRKSTINKIINYEKVAATKINWSICNNHFL